MLEFSGLHKGESFHGRNQRKRLLRIAADQRENPPADGKSHLPVRHDHARRPHRRRRFRRQGQPAAAPHPQIHQDLQPGQIRPAGFQRRHDQRRMGPRAVAKSLRRAGSASARDPLRDRTHPRRQAGRIALQPLRQPAPRHPQRRRPKGRLQQAGARAQSRRRRRNRPDEFAAQRTLPQLPAQTLARPRQDVADPPHDLSQRIPDPERTGPPRRRHLPALLQIRRRHRAFAHQIDDRRAQAALPGPQAEHPPRAGEPRAHRPLDGDAAALRGRVRVGQPRFGFAAPIGF